MEKAMYTKTTTVPRQASAIALVAALAFTVFPQQVGAGGPYQVYTVEPCRILDTRFGSGDAFGGAPHRLAPNETMSIDVTEGFIAGQGGASDCQVPFPEAKGVFINVGAVQPPGAMQMGSSMNNHLTIYPYQSPAPLSAALSYDPHEFAIANAIFVPLCTAAHPTGTGCGDDLNLMNGPSAYVDLVIDVMGYVQ